MSHKYEKLCFWFRTVTGTTPDGRKTLVILRKRLGGESGAGRTCGHLPEL